MSKRFDTVYYHDPCCDGFCAAWAARQACPGAKFIPIQYGKFAALDDVLGKRVLVVDFSWPAQGAARAEGRRGRPRRPRPP
jgi:hypothetical protein